MSRFAEYSDYRPSDHDWFPSVPEHWEVRKLAHAFMQIGSGTTPKTDRSEYYENGTIPWVNTGDLDDGPLVHCAKKITERATADYSTLKLYPRDALLFAMYGATIGKLGVLKFPATVNQACCVFSGQSPISTRFLFYWFLGLRQEILSLATGGGQPNVSQDILRTLRVACPAKDEQKQIASFLDYETAKIDALIEKQQQLIALLGEKRQAVISHAVTKGLNPDAPMRDSGVEWLGKVPEHWDVKRLKHLFREPLRNGVSPQTPTDGGTFTFSIAAVRNGVVSILNHLKHAQISAADSRRYLVEDRDVMMMRGNGSRDLVGSVGIVHELPKQPCIYPDILIRLRFSSEVDPRYGVFFLNSTVCRPQVAMGAKTAAGIWKVSGGTVSEFVVPVPPPEEQVAIREHLEATISEFDRLVDLAESQEELLQERRIALISAAVTGKIDVRSWKPPSADSQLETEMQIA